MRMMHNTFRIGGIPTNLPRGQIDKCVDFCDYCFRGVAEYRTVGGKLALGKNLLIVYMPREGYHNEDATLNRALGISIYSSFFTYGNKKFRFM